jgi:hypothetical protein
MFTKPDDDLLLQIARQHFPQIETLDHRNADELDFHQIAVWTLKAALEAAFAAGRASAAP